MKNAFSVGLYLATTVAAAGDFEIDWWTVDAGGTLEAEGDDWHLAGTIGQWDANPEPATGNGWSVSGGFWYGDHGELPDLLFSDQFEGF